MKHPIRNSILCATLILATAMPFILENTGCTSTSTVTESTNSAGVVTSVTNTITTVNEAALLLDTSILQGATAIAVSTIVQKDPSAVPALKQAETALGEVLGGATTNSTQQILTALGQGSNATLTAEIAPLVGTISGLEQTLLQKYGATVSGEITIAIAKAVTSGFAVGLAGH